MTCNMRIASEQQTPVCEEAAIYNALLPLRGARILELGCGKAVHTRTIAERCEARSIVAMEVDRTQHSKNLQIADLPTVEFRLGGAEAIPAEDEQFDLVLMFKSLHHVPLPVMGQALGEIRRVLRPGGLAYISEPVYAGSFNEILRLFHDEKQVREAAFAAVGRAVSDGLFELVTETFFQTPTHFSDFAQFEQQVLGVTHTRHELSPALYETVRTRFLEHMTEAGADFLTPIRVDLLKKPE